MSKFIGDLLLTFFQQPSTFPTRTATENWTVAARCDAWQFWTHPGTPLWKGFPSQQISNEFGQLWLVGELDSPLQMLLEGYSKEGDVAALNEHIARANGRFLIWLYEARSRQWHLWTDRFGTLHAYYAHSGTKAAIGTFFPAVAAAASQRLLDWVGLAGFFSFGFFPQERTYFQDVRILRPATHYVFSDKGDLIEQTRYWQWWHVPDCQRSYQDTVDEYATIFDQVMVDHLAGGQQNSDHQNRRVALPISGGLDSRSTVVPITNQQVPAGKLWSYSYGYADDSVETRIARRIAAARNLPFQAFTIRPYLFDNIEQVLAWTEGFQDITQPRQAFVRDEIAASADYLIGGLWGDVWHDDMGISNATGNEQTEDDIVTHTLHKMAKGGRQWLVEHLVKPQLRGETVDALLYQQVQEEMGKLGAIDDPDFRVKAYKTEQWSFRWSIPPTRVFQSAAWPSLIFYDTRLADFFCTVPTAYVSQRRLQIDHIKRYAPDLAHITWQAYDANLYRYQHFHTWQLPKRSMKKIWRILTQKQILERNWEVQFLHAQGRAGLERWLLQSGLYLHEFIAPQEIHQLLDSFYSAPVKSRLSYSVSMLLTFSGWLEKFGK